ncbi:hypothetical protein BKA01_007679 [Pseudonocardia eucalypti]|uniref:DUF6817 domain-containing protein n=1 Tax=Pseudonocardia eucalypti TaxID=648755 RepID=UPI0017E6E85F|nr:hypothetical protein [Pseudonocardia eucalypti]
MDRRFFLQTLALSSLAGCGPVQMMSPASAAASTKAATVDEIIDRRIATNVTGDEFVAVLTANPNIVRRAPKTAAAYRAGLRDPAALAQFNQGRIKALRRLKAADLDPTIKMFMLDLQLEKVDHSVAMCMDHFVGVYELLRQWGHRDEIAHVGLFHAIYGTEFNIIDLLNYKSPADRARVQSVVGDGTERWIVLYGLLTSCSFVRGTRDTGKPVTSVDFFEPTNVLPRAISDDDFRTLAELQVANAYEPYVSSKRQSELGLGRKFTLLREYLSTGGQAAIDDVLRVFPKNTDADIGCA